MSKAIVSERSGVRNRSSSGATRRSQTLQKQAEATFLVAITALVIAIVREILRR